LNTAKLGLVGAAVSDFRGIGELSRHILQCGGKVSVSSRESTDSTRDDRGAKERPQTVPGARGGSGLGTCQENISEEQILAACDMHIRKDILNLRLYFIIGLRNDDGPERNGDSGGQDSADGDRGSKERKTWWGDPFRKSFVPKPSTPFQWCGMEA
jgi:hypothetical protein